jgi:hypothetical protein
MAHVQGAQHIRGFATAFRQHLLFSLILRVPGEIFPALRIKFPVQFPREFSDKQLI